MEDTPQPSLPSEHFLNLPRPDIIIGGGEGVVDTTTLAAHDFDVDTRTGFMPPDPPIARLPEEWEPWEVILEKAMKGKLQLAIKQALSTEEAAMSAAWRAQVRQLPILSTRRLAPSELLLRRAHHVLTYIMHFYIHTLPLTDRVLVPMPISIPLLRVSRHLQLPPVATYSDTVLYNWGFRMPPSTRMDVDMGVDIGIKGYGNTLPCAPALDNLRSQDLFTGTPDEEAFYLSSARIELRGVEALDLMRATMDEMFVGDEIAVRRITLYLGRLAEVVHDLVGILMDVRKECDPDIFYRRVRPWFCGQDADPAGREWEFEGVGVGQGVREWDIEGDGNGDDLEKPEDLSGPSAGQSAFIHALDIFLGLDNCTQGGTHTQPPSQSDARTLLRRMQIYMPRHHRAFLRHLTANPRPVRTLVERGNPELVGAYNQAVGAVKAFRDAHIRIVAIYIVGPASRERLDDGKGGDEKGGGLREGIRQAALRGTGGTQLVQFLKGVRDKTAEALVPTAP
ncbi:Indoleamine 2,3-dioxygenase [Scleroderma yunnanense]